MRVSDVDVAPDDRVASGGWAEIDRREAKLGIHVGAPLLLRPDASVDPRLGSFLRRSRFAMRSPGTQWAYVLDYRLFFSFLWARGKDWDQATEDDVYDWEHWRRRDTANPGRVGGAKWAREVAALRLLYEWAVDRDHIAKSPIVTRDVRVHDGRTVQVAAIAPRDVVRSRVKWLTRRAYRRWRDIGMRDTTRATPRTRPGTAATTGATPRSPTCCSPPGYGCGRPADYWSRTYRRLMVMTAGVTCRCWCRRHWPRDAAGSPSCPGQR